MPERLESKRVKAYKQHICNNCRGIILKGEEYVYDRLINDGEIYAWHSCDRCAKYVSECYDKDYCDCYTEGLTDQILMDFMYEYHRSVAEDWWSND